MIGEADSPSIATPSTQATMTRASRQTAAAAPGETGRSVVSVLLVIYLVGLALSVAGNSASGTSALVRAVKGRLFAVWMVPAWLDLGFDTRLTYGLPEDGDHAIELRPHGRRAAEPILLPPPKNVIISMAVASIAVHAIATAISQDRGRGRTGGSSAGGRFRRRHRPARRRRRRFCSQAARPAGSAGPAAVVFRHDRRSRLLV